MRKANRFLNNLRENNPYFAEIEILVIAELQAEIEKNEDFIDLGAD